MDVNSITAKDLLKKSFIQIDKSAKLSETLGKLGLNPNQELLVFDDGTYYGNISTELVLRSRVDVSKAKVQTVVVASPQLSFDATLLEIAQNMYSTNSKVLPVLADFDVQGVVFASDVVQQIKKFDDLAKLKVSTLVGKPITIEENESVAKAIKLMRTKKIEKLVVVNKEEVTGMLFFDELMAKFIRHKKADGKRYLSSNKKSGASRSGPEPKNVMQSSISNQMVKVFPTLNEDAVLREAVSNFNPKLGVVVLANNKLKGILTTKTMLQTLLSLKEQERDLQISGMPELDEVDEPRVNRLINTTYDRLSRTFSKKPNLTLRFKQENTIGPKRRHTVSATLRAGSHAFHTKKVSWSFLTAIQQTMAVLEKEIRREMMSHSKRRKKPSKRKPRH